LFKTFYLFNQIHKITVGLSFLWQIKYANDIYTFKFNILFALGILCPAVLTFEDLTEDFAQINKTWLQKSHSL